MRSTLVIPNPMTPMATTAALPLSSFHAAPPTGGPVASVEAGVPTAKSTGEDGFHCVDGKERIVSADVPVRGIASTLAAGVVSALSPALKKTAAAARIPEGFVHPGEQSLFVFDLDGTFADLFESEHAKSWYAEPDKTLDENIQAIVKFKNKVGGKLVFASARTLSNFQKFQEELAKRGVKLPTPDYYVGNNGNFIYKNVDGKLATDEVYAAELLRRTHFDHEAIYAMLKDLGAQSRYRLSDGRRDVPAPAGTPQKLLDFAESQLAYYEFFPTESFIELMYAPEAQASIAKDLAEGLARLGVEYSLTWKKFPAANLDWIAGEAKKRPELSEILRLARPTRLDQDGGLYTVHISAARKRTAMEYLMENLGIQPESVVAAGNDMNDLSMAELARDRGTWFIAVGNASEDFKSAVKEIHDHLLLKARAGYQRVNQMVLGEANESVRIGLENIRSEIHDAKAKHYRAAIDRISSGNPEGEGEAAVMAEFQTPKVQKTVEDKTWAIFWSLPDYYPEQMSMEIGKAKATEIAIIRLLEAMSVGEPFRLYEADAGYDGSHPYAHRPKA